MSKDDDIMMQEGIMMVKNVVRMMNGEWGLRTNESEAANGKNIKCGGQSHIKIRKIVAANGNTRSNQQQSQGKEQ